MSSSSAASVGPRPRVDDHHLLRLASHLTERDRMLIRLLYDHRVLTSLQVCDVAFSSVRRAEARLHALYQLRVVDRFRPHQWPGSAPYHWVLDHAGAAVIAAERGVDVEHLPWRHERAMSLQDSITLRHRVGCNGFFTALLREAGKVSDRRVGSVEVGVVLRGAMGRARPARRIRRLARGGARVPFILEYDRGTETGERLARKIPGYGTLLAVSASPVALLFCFGSTRREVEARRALANGPPDLATAVVPRGASPAGRFWLPLRGTGRLGLAELVQFDLNPTIERWVSVRAATARLAQ